MLARLLVPVQLFSSPVAGAWAETERQTEQQVEWQAEQVYFSPPLDGDFTLEPVLPSGEPSAEPSGSQPVPPLIPSPWEPVMVPAGSLRPGPAAAIEPPDAQEPEPEDTEDPAPVDPVPVLLGVWLAGSVLLALVLSGSNLRFARRLQRQREALEGADCPLPVYIAEGLPSPCLFGLVHPAVYVTAETARDPAMLRHVLAHEYTHFRHLDHIWNLLRCAALCVHWWNPLVWLAAELSRRDGELCCDEGALKRLGDAERLAYGRTLLSLLAAKPGPGALLTCATTMNGSRKSLKERVERIARAPKRWLWAAVVMVLAAALACVCAFGQAQPEQDGPAPVGLGQSTAEDGDEEPSDPNRYTLSAGLRFFEDPSGTDSVRIEGLGDTYAEYREEQFLFTGEAGFACSRLEGELVEGCAFWTDETRSALSVEMAVQIQWTENDEDRFHIRFTADLDRGTILEQEFTCDLKNSIMTMTDTQMRDMALVLDSLMSAAEQYALTGQPDMPNRVLPFASTADLNRNGVLETLRVGHLFADDGVTSLGLFVEVWEDDALLWSGRASGTTAFLLRTTRIYDTRDTLYDLIEYDFYDEEGIVCHRYRLFDLTGDGPDGVRIDQEAEVEFPCTAEGMARWKQAGRTVDMEAAEAFAEKIEYGLILGNTLLTDTIPGLDNLFTMQYYEMRRLLVDFPDFYFYDMPGSKLLTFSNLTQAITSSTDVIFIAEQYALIDLDRDGETELVLKVNGQGGYLIFHRSAQGLECYSEVLRGLMDLKADGTFMGSSGSMNWGYYTISAFTSSGIEDVRFTWCESTPDYAELYFVNGAPATRGEFSVASNAQDQKEDAPWQPWTWEDGALDAAVEWLTDAGVWQVPEDQRLPSQDGSPLPQSPDLNHNGIPETIWTGTSFADDGVTPLGLLVEVWEGDALLWSRTASNQLHAEMTSFLLCRLEDRDYLLQYTPCGMMGLWDFTYCLFDLTGSGEDRVHIVRENEVSFPFTPTSADMVGFWTTFGGPEIDIEALESFDREINELLSHSVILINSLMDTFEDPAEPLYDGQLRDEITLLRSFLGAWGTPPPDAAEARQLLRSVLLGEDALLTEVNGALRVDDLTPEVTSDRSFHLVPYSFALVDLDQDGIDEVVLGLGIRDNGLNAGTFGYEILHVQDGQVYGIHSVYRGLEDLNADGSHCFNNGLFDSYGYETMRLDGTKREDDKFLYCVYSSETQEFNCYQNGLPISLSEYEAAEEVQQAKPDVTWYDFTQENITALLS